MGFLNRLGEEIPLSLAEMMPVPDLGPKKIRVNCISAGAVNTLAARGISGFTSMMKHYEEHAPLKRNVELEELGQTGVFLASDGGAAITGQVIYVDCGYQIMGM